MEKKTKLGYNKHLTLNNLLILIRVFCVVAVTVAVLVTIVLCVSSTRVVGLIESENISELANNSKVINYISMINNMSSSDVTNLIYDVPNTLVLSCIYTIIPTFILVITAALIIFSGFYLFKFTAGVKSQKTLFTKEKYFTLRMIRVFTYISFIVLIFMFGISYFFIGLMYVMFYELMLYLFDSMMETQKKDSK